MSGFLETFSIDPTRFFDFGEYAYAQNDSDSALCWQ
jgi:hypothetical protein